MMTISPGSTLLPFNLFLQKKIFESENFQKEEEPYFYYSAYLFIVLTKIETLTNYDEVWFLFNEEVLGFFFFFRFRFILPPLLEAPSGPAVAAAADISCSSSELSRVSPIPSSSLSSSSKPKENNPCLISDSKIKAPFICVN